MMNAEEYPCLVGVRLTGTVAAHWTYDEAFTTEMTGVLIGMVSDIEEAELGTITLLKVSACEACNQKISLAEICDSHSDFLLSIYATIFDASTDEPKDELEIEPGWVDLLVLLDFTIKPEYRTRAILTSAFQAAISLLGPRDLIVAAMEGADYTGLQLTKDEWKALGFVRIAGSQFVFRDSACLNPYRNTAHDE
jgi:hypothetical protein